MNPAKVASIQTVLRRMIASLELTLKASRQGGTVQVLIAGETVGTVDTVVDEDGESWVLTVPVLPEDL